MIALGWHWTAEAHDADRARLADPDVAREVVLALAARLGLTVAAPPIARTTGVGAAAVALLMESHVAVHTDVGQGAAFVDVFSCVPFDDAGAAEVVAKAYASHRVAGRIVARGAA